MTSRVITGGVRLKATVVEDCFNYARENGWEVFGLGYEKECFTAADAADTYHQQETSDKCENGVGGPNAIDVYKIVFCTGELSNITSALF